MAAGRCCYCSWRPPWLLWAVLGFLVPGNRCGSPRHSLCYSYMKVSESSQGLPPAHCIVDLDGHHIARYDSPAWKMVPLVSWMEVEEVKTFVVPEMVFTVGLEMLSQLISQTGGNHTWQVCLGCELREDGSKRGFFCYGYDGRDFISFDVGNLTWVPAQPQAQKVKEEWEKDRVSLKRNEVFLEEICIEWLKKYLSYQKGAPKKTKPPVGKVTHTVVDDSLEVLICQAFGFYPKEIQATWTKDGEVCKDEILHRNVAPNSDGTYYLRLSIEIDPKERERFRCHLEHEGLQEPLVLAFQEKTDMLFFFLAGALIILLICGCLFRKKLHQAMTTYLDHLPSEKPPPSSTYVTEDEIQSQAMLPPKVTSEGCCGQKTELREGEKIPLRASLEASSDNVEGPSPENSEEEHLEDAEATKPGMEGLEEVSPGTSEGPSEVKPDEHLAGETWEGTPV